MLIGYLALIFGIDILHILPLPVYLPHFINLFQTIDHNNIFLLVLVLLVLFIIIAVFV